MDQDDPEKRIADLERQLADARAAGDPGKNQGSLPPPAFDWQNPPQGRHPPSRFPRRRARTGAAGLR
jgi:hypothetical protein